MEPETSSLLPETMLPTGAPEEFGFPSSPNVYEVKRWILQEKFLAAFAETGAINLSATTAGHSVEAYYNWLNADSFMFQKRFERAKAQVLERMVIEIDRRAFEGYDHPVIHKGKITGTYKAYDSNLAMFRVKKLDPSYRENFELVENISEVKDLLTALRNAGTARLPEPVVVEGTSRPAEPTLSEPPLPGSREPGEPGDQKTERG